jgi:transglutaminase-like putative cysteine protease
VSDIPGELLANSDLVIRSEDVRFDVRSAKKAIKTVRYVATLLNEKAQEEAECVVLYDKNSTVQNLAATVYDHEGNEVKKLYGRDFEDRSLVSSVSVLDDNRMKYARLTHPHYPYTIDVQYEISYSGLMHYPVWAPQDAFRKSVVASTFMVHMPSEENLRYKEYNLQSTAEVTTGGDQRIYTWHSGPLKAILSEPYMPYLSEIVPVVRIAPNAFEYEKYNGRMDTWDALVAFQMMLNEGRQELPQATVQQVREMVQNAPSDLEKIRSVYRFVQSNTRYVSVQLGIGGWQPWDATFVDEHKYGDCKALTNYTMALLKSVGIPSIYTLVSAGKNRPDIDRDFSHLQFNHAILCVPNNGDTVWLECTSQDNPFGYTGRFTGDRDVLLCTESGAKIVHTPVYTLTDNRLEQHCDVSIDVRGNAAASYHAAFGGLQYDRLAGVSGQVLDKQKKYLYEMLDLPHFEISDFEIIDQKERLPEARLHVDLRLPRYAAVSGNRIFFQPNLLNKRTVRRTTDQERTYDLVLRFPYVDIDTVQFVLPDSFHFEFVPEAVYIKSVFGTYSAQFLVEQGKLLYVREVRMRQGVFPPEAYGEFLEFYNKTAEADQLKIVLVRST